MIYLVTHAQVFKTMGDPSLTLRGETKTKNLVFPKDTTLIVSGTGKRHRETADIINCQLEKKVRVIYTPFCGTPDVRDYDDETHTFGLFADGTRGRREDYIYTSMYFNTWGFIRFLTTLSENIVFSVGHQFMDSLNLIGYYEPGKIFALDPLRGTIAEKQEA